jgi:GNAT superfamily N-acetyltransferase
MEYRTRRIGPDDAALLRQIRLAALTDSPQAFASTLEHEESRPFEEWERRTNDAAVGLDQTIVLGDIGGEVVGIVGGFRPDPESGDRQLYGLWVAPPARGTGLGEILVESIIAWAAEVGARRLILWVTEINEPAIELYQRMGFVRTGVRQTLPWDERLTEIEMVREVRASSPPVR